MCSLWTWNSWRGTGVTCDRNRASKSRQGASGFVPVHCLYGTKQMRKKTLKGHWPYTRLLIKQKTHQPWHSSFLSQVDEIGRIQFGFSFFFCLYFSMLNFLRNSQLLENRSWRSHGTVRCRVLADVLEWDSARSVESWRERPPRLKSRAIVRFQGVPSPSF